MQFKLPKNSEQFVWTNHSIDKMRQYGLSEQRVRSVLHTPKRKEDGVAPNTSAVMQSTGTKKHPSEIWVMYQDMSRRPEGLGLRPSTSSAVEASENIKNKNDDDKFKNNLVSRLHQDFGEPKKLRIISTWRYPGISPIRTVPNIPEEVWDILDGRDDIK